MWIVKDTTNIRVYRDSLRRLKIRAAREGITMMGLIDELSKLK